MPTFQSNWVTFAAVARLGLAALAFSGALWPTSSAAQGASATVRGIVVDESGAIVPGALVEVRSLDTGFQRHIVTGSQGQFVLPTLPPGRYRLAAQLAGFVPVEVPAMTLNVGDEVAVTLKMKVGAIGESVIVTADPQAVNTSGSLGTVIDRELVSKLPLNGRSFLPLIALTPGVTLTPASFGNEGQFSVNGQRPDANYVMVDGVSANFGISAGAGLNASAGGALPVVSANGSMSNLISLEAMEEFRITTSGFAPEYGRTPGGQVSIVSRSGSDRYSGSLFEYFRDDALDASDWFGNRSGLAKPDVRQHNLGGVLGGPLKPSKVFFFFSAEHLRLTLPRVGVDSVPSIRVRQMAPAAVSPYLAVFPLPTGPETTNGLAEYAFAVSDESRLDAVSGKINGRIGALQIFGRVAHSPAQILERILATDRLTRTETTTVTVGSDAIFRGATVDLRLNVSNQSAANSLSFADRDGGVPADEGQILPAGISLDDAIFGFTAPGRGYLVGKNVNNRQRQVNLTAALSKSFGSHLIKLGVDWRRLLPYSGPRSYQEQLTFTTLADLLAGRVSRLTVSTIAPSSFRVHNLGLFFQDSWTASASTSVTYGLRWDLEPAPTDVLGQPPAAAINFDDLSRIDIAPPGTDLWRSRFGNFAPRLGISQRLRDDGGTLLRGGIGLFYDLISKGTGDLLGIGYPFNRQRESLAVLMPVPGTLLTPPVLDPLAKPYTGFVSLVDPDIESPQVMHWNVSVDQRLGSQNMVTVSYVGARGRQLLRRERYVAPNANIVELRQTVNADRSSYRALQTAFRTRPAGGVQVLASYTLASARDTGSSTTFAPALSVLGEDKEFAASNFDIRHTASLAATSELSRLFGNAFDEWGLDAIWRFRSAPVVNVTTGVDSLGIGSTTVVRPNLIEGVALYVEDAQAPGGRRINRAAFQVPPTGQQGNLPRNALRGFSATQIDLALSRRVTVVRNVRLLLKAECFNVFNTPNFAPPTGSLASANFGVPTQMLNRQLGQGGTGGGFDALYQMGGPRSIQLSVKATF